MKEKVANSLKIDVHAHICISGGLFHGKQYRNYPESIANLKASMAENGIDHTILIPNNVEGPEMPMLEQMMEMLKGEKCFSYLGCPNVLQEKPGDHEYYRGLLAKGVIKGLKFFPGHDPIYVNDERCLPYFEMCQELGWPVVFHSTDGPSNPPGRMCGPYSDPRLVVEMARKYPELRLVIAHFHWPKFGYCYEATRGVANIYFDLSGVVDEDETAGQERIREPLLKVLGEDPRKVMFGTDWPGCDSELMVAMVEALTISVGVREMIYWRNAVEVYGLNICGNFMKGYMGG